ncbi:MAG: hypothetical protein ACLVKO_08115 [Dysgonomonas sp.]
MEKCYCIISFGLLFLFSACWTGLGRKDIVDYYELTWGDYYTQLWDGYCIGCSQGSKSDSILQDIKNYEWNNYIIVGEKNIKEERRWYAFWGNGEKLECGYDNILLGPMYRAQIDSILRKYNYTNLQKEVLIE